MTDDMIKNLLSVVSGVEDITQYDAFNLRINGSSGGYKSSENIKVIPKEMGGGLDIHIKAGSKGETVHVPAIISNSAMFDLVYNDFIIEEGADVTIVAGCGIHNDCGGKSHHNGIHNFHLAKNSRVVYIEKHIGEGDGRGENVIDTITNVFAKENSYLEMNTTHLEGIDSTVRTTNATLDDNATFVVTEKIMTHDNQEAKTIFTVELNGKDSSSKLISRAVAKDNSKQVFTSKITGNNACYGHSECDAIIMGKGTAIAEPVVIANDTDATLIHEATIGKIAGEQLTKLMSLGLTEEEAEGEIIKGFLK